ncbi:MAG: glycerol-3-phosphate dehydrogenase [Myxococcales bacterium]|nr:MAG: glycerol-3-phosphate dehydrogenase [Myxococcales bacterium]
MSELEVAVIGGGLWGQGLAKAAARSGAKVTLVSRRPPEGLHLSAGIAHASSYEAARSAKLIILATPTHVVRQVARELGDHLDGSHYVVHGVRGLVHDDTGPSLHTVSDVLREELPARRLGALGGPALAEDLDAGRPSVLVSASRFPEVNRALADAFTVPMLRVYSTSDLRGLEWASALVGCLAIGIGFAKGVGLSPGLVAAVLCRSMAEAGRIASAAGGDEHTLLGLGGYGDLLASVEMEDRPEVVLGRALAGGATVAEALEKTGARVEAVDLLPRVVEFARTHGVRAPIFAALERGFQKTATPHSLIEELMTLPMN